MSVPGTLIRVLAALAVAVGCGEVQPPGPPALTITEAIIGRAVHDGNPVFLTDAPALLSVDSVAGRITRTPLTTSSGDAFKPWGLAEAGGALFTVSGFLDLFEIEANGRATRVARLDRSLANLFDLDAGMAGQPASPEAAAPLALAVRTDGAVEPMPGPPRPSYGLSPVEDSILNLLSCSAPPAVVCWLPDRPALLRVAGAELRPAVDLEGLPAIAPSLLIAGTAHRAIDDVLATLDAYWVLHREPGEPSQQRLTAFDTRGRRMHSLKLAAPFRALLTMEQGRVVALTSSGIVERVEVPW
jgi:hypothetical protein